MFSGMWMRSGKEEVKIAIATSYIAHFITERNTNALYKKTKGK